MNRFSRMAATAAVLLLSSGSVVFAQGYQATAPTQPTAPPGVKGFGSLAGTSASALVSTLTVGPNSATWPTSPGQVFVVNPAASAAVAYACPLGGTCSAAVGIPISAGTAYGFFQPVTAMTVFQAGGSSIMVQW